MAKLPSLDSNSPLNLRKAVMRDVPALLDLVNHWAAQGVMLAKTREIIYPQIRDFYVLETIDGAVAACVGLHILWHDLAEVRSLAVHPDFQGKGLGKRLVLGVEPEARSLGILRLFAWTLEPDFFIRCGYRGITLDELPPKVWKEYSKSAMLKVLN
jgi:amino-acid N-acetyltransferase